VSEVAKKHGVSDVTIYAWRSRFGELEAVDVKRLRHLGGRQRTAQGGAERARHGPTTDTDHLSRSVHVHTYRAYQARILASLLCAKRCLSRTLTSQGRPGRTHGRSS
jgi:hypothetical protein